MAGAPISVLVVDDEAPIRQAVTDYLADEGRFAARGVATAAEAFEVLEQGGVRVCLVDLRLKGGDGFDFIEGARARFPSVLFLIQTGSHEADVRERARSSGIAQDRILLKPFRLEALVHAIDHGLTS